MLVPGGRFTRWVANFETRHGTATLAVDGGSLTAIGSDGSTFRASQPFDTAYADAADVTSFAGAAHPPEDWGVLLVRKGGFAMARLAGGVMVESKTGQRHVQGRTKAGGQSQQRFARRRDNQARQAFAAAADHAVRILSGLGPVVVGGDRPAVDEVLADVRLSGLRVISAWLPVPDPKRNVLNQAVLDAQAIVIDVTNA